MKLTMGGTILATERYAQITRESKRSRNNVGSKSQAVEKIALNI